jgi:hypothetical protein
MDAAPVGVGHAGCCCPYRLRAVVPSAGRPSCTRLARSVIPGATVSHSPSRQREPPAGTRREQSSRKCRLARAARIWTIRPRPAPTAEADHAQEKQQGNPHAAPLPFDCVVIAHIGAKFARIAISRVGPVAGAVALRVGLIRQIDDRIRIPAPGNCAGEWWARYRQSSP